MDPVYVVVPVIRALAVAAALLAPACGGPAASRPERPRDTLTAVRRVRLLIRGRVQGVSYRASTVEAARRLGGVTGWVKNTADGSVVAEVQGAPDAVDAMIDWCKDGPPAARVDGVEVIETPAVSGEKGFTIER